MIHYYVKSLISATGCFQENCSRKECHHGKTEVYLQGFCFHIAVLLGQRREKEFEKELKLSDAYAVTKEGEKPQLELKVRVVNINPEAKHELLEECRVLKEYSEFVSAVRSCGNDVHALAAIVDDFISRGILKDFLERNTSEVINMLIAEYSYEDDIQVQRQESFEDGREEGIKEGKKEGIQALIKFMQEEGKSPEFIFDRICKDFHLTKEEAAEFFS